MYFFHLSNLRACLYSYETNLNLWRWNIGIENKIEAVPYSNPEILEQILEEISDLLHKNHYLITDTKRRLIDIYGVEDNFQYNNLERDKIGEINKL